MSEIDQQFLMQGHHAVVVQESAELTEQTQPVEPLLSLEVPGRIWC